MGHNRITPFGPHSAHPATSGPPVLGPAIFSLPHPMALCMLVLAAEDLSMSASQLMCLMLWWGSVLRTRGRVPPGVPPCSLSVHLASAGGQSIAVPAEDQVQTSLEPTVWATALDLSVLELRINRKRKYMDQCLFIQVHVKITKKNEE